MYWLGADKTLFIEKSGGTDLFHEQKCDDFTLGHYPLPDKSLTVGTLVSSLEGKSTGRDFLFKKVVWIHCYFYSHLFGGTWSYNATSLQRECGNVVSS